MWKTKLIENINSKRALKKLLTNKPLKDIELAAIMSNLPDTKSDTEKFLIVDTIMNHENAQARTHYAYLQLRRSGFHISNQVSAMLELKILPQYFIDFVQLPIFGVEEKVNAVMLLCLNGNDQEKAASLFPTIERRLTRIKKQDANVISNNTSYKEINFKINQALNDIQNAIQIHTGGKEQLTSEQANTILTLLSVFRRVNLERILLPKETLKTIFGDGISNHFLEELLETSTMIDNAN